MPVVNIYWWSGRTEEQKRKVAEGITKLFESTLGIPPHATNIVTKLFESTLGIPPHATNIVFQDIPKNDWAIAGKLCSDSD
jgi:phenylpyruvate tautomerase PptA (4-oxalocrotonate tautomerase family)